MTSWLRYVHAVPHNGAVSIVSTVPPSMHCRGIAAEEGRGRGRVLPVMAASLGSLDVQLMCMLTLDKTLRVFA